MTQADSKFSCVNDSVLMSASVIFHITCPNYTKCSTPRHHKTEYMCKKACVFFPEYIIFFSLKRLFCSTLLLVVPLETHPFEIIWIWFDRTNTKYKWVISYHCSVYGRPQRVPWNRPMPLLFRSLCQSGKWLGYIWAWNSIQILIKSHYHSPEHSDPQAVMWWCHQQQALRVRNSTCFQTVSYFLLQLTWFWL